MGLLPYQIAPCEQLVQILKTHEAALDASDTGVGKTYVAVATAKALDIPVGIVCPKSVIPSWTRVCEAEGLSPSFILNYEKITRGTTEWVVRNKRNFEWAFQGLVIFDEVHRCRHHTSLNSKMMIAAWKTQHIRCLCLSATAAQNPLEMRALGYVLGLHQDYNFWSWAMRLGIKKNRWGGWAWTGTDETLSGIHKQIFPARGVRVRIRDLGEAFPENKIIPELVEVGDERSLEDYQKALKELERLKDAKKKDYPSIFTAQLRARQMIEILKVPVLVERAQILLEEGKSVVIFCNFNATLEQLAAELNTDCVIRDQPTDEREQHLRNFRTNERKVIVANIQSGGVGVSLSDNTGEHPRVSLICPTYNAVDLRQALGRVHRQDSKSPCIQYLLYAAGTVEARVFKSVSSKLDRLDLLNDNELSETLCH